MQKDRRRVDITAAGEYLQGQGLHKRVVKWDSDCFNVRPGSGIIVMMVVIRISVINA